MALNGSKHDVDGEEGGATVVVAASMAALLILTLGALTAARAYDAQGNAQRSADVAALAAATALTTVSEAPPACEIARRVAASNGTDLERCEIHGEDVVVGVSMPVELFLITRHAQGVARAGPDDG